MKMTTPPSLLSVRMSAFRSCHHSSPIANHPRHVVECHALTSADGQPFIVVIPRGEEKELTTLASFHASTSGFGKVGKAILLEDDEGVTFLKSGAHDSFLARGDAGRDKDCSLVGKGQEMGGLAGNLLGREAARALHLHS
jgi:hypothetical protein